MTLHISQMGKLIFDYTVLCPFYRSRVFMHINTCMAYNCMHYAVFLFFFAFCTEKDIRRNWTKPPYISLPLDKQPREPVCPKNGRINIIYLKKLLQFIKRVAMMLV